MIRIRVLGCYSIQAGDEPSDRARTQPRRLAVLALIARAGERGITRDKILSLLWPDADEESGRHALTQAVYALRKDLGATDLVSGVREIRLDPLLVSCDLHDFESAIRAGQLEKAVECYGGPFLDGFRLPGSDEFERWVDEQRLSLEQAYADALTRLARSATESGDANHAVGWWRKLAGLQPMNGRYAVELMQALVRTGDRQGALRHARIYEMLIEQELDLPADREVVELAERIRDGSYAPPPVAPQVSVSAVETAAPPIPALAPVAAGVPAPEPEPPFVAEVVPTVEAAIAASATRAVAAPEPAVTPPSPSSATPALSAASVPVPALMGMRGERTPIDPPVAPSGYGNGEFVEEPEGDVRVERRQRVRHPPAAASHPWLRSAALTLAASFLVATTAFGVRWWGSTNGTRPSPSQNLALGDHGRVVVGFSSSESDSALASAVAEAVRVDLAQSRLFQVLEPRDVIAGFLRADLPASIRLDSEAALKMARFEGIQLMVVGDVARVGPGYIFSARVIAVPSGNLLAAARESARDSSSIIDAIDRLSGAIRERLVESTAAGRPAGAGGR